MNSNLIKLGWNKSFQKHFQEQNLPNTIPARIVRENRGKYIIHNGEKQCGAIIPGATLIEMQSTSGFPTVGDWVAVTPINRDTYQIQALLKRKTLFERQSSGKRTNNQLIAANIDYLFIVTGLDHDFNLHRIQRYVSQVWNGGAEPVLILNKSDLLENPNSVVENIRKALPTIDIHAVSAVYFDNIECLSQYLNPGQTVALSGSSGVGKTSLINALVGEQLPTFPNRSKDSRGRHTTTWRELILASNGYSIIDLPGMREFQLTGETEGIYQIFSDIKEIAQECRYKNCNHEGEPGCAIQTAIQNGEIEHDRYLQYLKLTQESITTASKRKTVKPKNKTKQNKREKKESFFKDIAIQQKKNAKSKRKFNQFDGF